MDVLTRGHAAPVSIKAIVFIPSRVIIIDIASTLANWFDWRVAQSHLACCGRIASPLFPAVGRSSSFSLVNRTVRSNMQNYCGQISCPSTERKTKQIILQSYVNEGYISLEVNLICPPMQCSHLRPSAVFKIYLFPKRVN